MTGVAQAADSIEELASFIGGEPEAAHEDDEHADDSQPDDGVGDDETDASDELADEQDEAEETPEDQTSGRKFKVPVKGEDGQETIEEVDEKELVAGYQRQKAFTQKTMELAERERQAAAVVQQRVTEASQYALQQAELARSTIERLAGFKSDEELARLAVDDPAGWVQEQQRMRQVQAVMAELGQTIQAEKSKLEQTAQEQMQQKANEGWKVLVSKGFDQAKLGDVFAKSLKAYGISQEELGKVVDPGIVLALRDAVAYRALQEKKPQIAQKVKDAERLPAARKTAPPQERVNRQLGEKFSKGRAKVNDLASFLANNKI